MGETARSLQFDGGSIDTADPIAFEQFSKRANIGGEERLMLAVLQDAVECQQYALSECPWEKQLFQEAETWILARNSDWAFSFENICETLNLDPGYIRRGLLIWKEGKRTASNNGRVRKYRLRS
jgi:hypothetical protein